MSLVALLLDAIAVGGYFVQDSSRTRQMFVAGIVVELIITLILLCFVIFYRGRRRQKRDYTFKGYRYVTFRYAFIILSFLGNLAILLLYFLNLKNGVSAVLFR